MSRLIYVLICLLFTAGCTASWSRFVADFEGQQIRVSGKLTDTDRISVKINEDTVISDWIVIDREGQVQGDYRGNNVRVECHRDPVASIDRHTFCEVFLQDQKIGELFFDVAGIEL